MSAEGNAYDTAKLEIFSQKQSTSKKKTKSDLSNNLSVSPIRSIRSHRDFGVVIAVWERVTNK